MNLSTEVKVTRVIPATATGTSDVNGTVIDMSGFDGVMFVGAIGSAAANNGIKVQQGAASNLADAADLAGSKVLSDGTQTQFVVDVFRPQERYVRPVMVRGTTTTVDAVFAIQYGGRSLPVTNTSAALAAELHVSPDEGTA